MHDGIGSRVREREVKGDGIIYPFVTDTGIHVGRFTGLVFAVSVRHLCRKEFVCFLYYVIRI